MHSAPAASRLRMELVTHQHSPALDLTLLPLNCPANVYGKHISSKSRKTKNKPRILEAVPRLGCVCQRVRVKMKRMRRRMGTAERELK
ncbi:hypothetical protein AOLI_G00006730 [Acnodon oligacanthus]